MRDWDSHFRNLSKRRADFGTSLTGDHSAHELSDLLAAKNSEITDIKNHVSTLGAHTGPEWPAWLSDWNDFLSDWNIANTYATKVVNDAKYDASPTNLAWTRGGQPWDGVYVEDVYQGVLKILQPAGPGTSRFQDLYRRYTQLPQSTPVPFRPVPQPTAPDLQLHALAATDTFAQNTPAFVKTIVGTVAPGLVPQTKGAADQYKAFDMAAFAKQHWKGLAAGGVGIVATLKILAKFGL